ncbi:right-handed parallel beta-helix repeat-containing protein [Phormidium sp. CLA17]|uniref:right-handed parallel beta-helix repeat-containing protein n=1 Tax=Leptolyngbya sp. Cla-17 TaxID=2803751 RepID=UPI00149135CB|nr:right-handed parallel beta-helix repeat-containing protein [Leptolyngbya sp. Cla-17]MBM0745464.1 right-handed parallel beta-helix repeat-containing protein [Leptolyngbya sp. Cla-17]
MRKLLNYYSPGLTLLGLIAGTALSFMPSLTSQAVEAPSLSPATAHALDAPRTLKEAKISTAEILGQAPETPAVPAPSTPATPATPTSSYTPIPIRGGVSFNSGPGVGYESSFFGLEGFVPLTQTPGKTLTYAQGRLLLDTNGGNPGSNFALGYRDFDPSSGRIVGGYVGVDVRDTGRTTFSQLGAGVEVVLPGVEFRVNGYLPVGDRRREVASQSFTDTASTSTSTSTSLSGGSGVTAPTTLRFQGNSLLFDSPTASTLTTTTRNQTTRFTRALDEVSLAGLDAEAGVKLAQLSPGSDLRSYLGLYYYSGEGVSGFVGVRGRLALRVNDTLTAGLAVQGDREFGTTAVATVSLQFPTIGRKTTGQPADNWARVGDSAIRNQAVAVTERTRTSTRTEITQTTQTVGSGSGGTVIVQNPATGQPYVFQHAVLGAAGGSGTFESPFGTVLAAITAAPGDGNGIVYVQAGTNPGIPAFTIQDGVQVLSSGVAQPLATVQAGTVQLPLSGTGTLPRVAGTVTMGNNTTLGGFNITGFGGVGVRGTDLRNVTIQDNVITAVGNNPGIFLDGNLTGAVTLRRNTIGTGLNIGMLLSPNQAVATPLTIDVSNNTVQNTADVGIRVQAQGNTTATATIANNTVTNTTVVGIDASSQSNSPVRVQIDNNQVNNVQFAGIGIRVISATAQMFASVTNNRVANLNAYAPGNQVEYQIVSQGTGTLCSRLLNNTASLSGYEFRNAGSTLQREPLVGNTGPVQPDIGVITPVAAGTCGF